MDIVISSGADWTYWDPVNQQWKTLNKPPTNENDIAVTGLDKDGNRITIYFKTDRVRSWLGGMTK